MVKAAKRPGAQKTEKDPSIFSQEYFLQNQADLMSSLCLIIMSGLLFKPTRALSAKFCFVQHNTTNLTDPEIKPMYQVGRADVLVTVFYSLLCIAVHAVENEYFWEKIARRLRLSKTRLSEFMSLGSTLPYHIAIVIGAFYVMKEEGLLLDPMALLTTVPAVEMPMLMKFYWLLILSFALHQYPEMYFMRVKNEEMPNKIIGYTAFIVPMTAAYITGLVYPGTLVLIIHCLIEILNAVATVMDCVGKQELAQPFYKMWSVGFIPARATITGLCALTFFNIQGVEGVSPVRLLACTIVLGGMVALQFYLGANFIHTVLSWRSEAKEVELAQKKADNFWQQRKEANKEAKKARAEKRVAKEAVVEGKTD